MIVSTSVRPNLGLGIRIRMSLGMCMGPCMNMNMIQRRGRSRSMNMNMNMNMSMHMRMGMSSTNRPISLGTSLGIGLSTYEEKDDYDCGYEYGYTYAYGYTHGHEQRHGYRYGGGYGYACESVVQGGETCHLISLFARAEFIHCRYTVFYLPHPSLIPHRDCHSHPSLLFPSNNPTCSCPFPSHIVHLDVPHYCCSRLSLPSCTN